MHKKKKNTKPEKSANTEDFASSLDTLTPEDLSQNEAPKEKADITGIIRGGLMLICAAVFVYSGYLVLDQLTSKARANSEYDDIRDMFYDNSGVSLNGTMLASLPMNTILPLTGNVYQQSEEADMSQLLLDRNKLKMLSEINPDICSWIKIDGTRVDYPVVQGADNDYYLHYNFKKDYLYSGTLFMDYHNSRNLLENFNTVIYGHNMNDGSMFHTLLNFKDEKFFRNGLVQITTEDGLYIYEVFSVHVVNETDPYFMTEFENEETFLEFAKNMQDQSMYSKNIEFTPQDRILTLSTCTNIRSYERFAVQARLIYTASEAPPEA